MTQLKGETLASDLARSREIRSDRSDVRDQISKNIHPSAVDSRLTSIALLTGGGDKPYALGMAEALTSAGIEIELIGSDDLSVPVLLNNPRVKFYNLRRDQRSEVSVGAKIMRVALYYWRLIRYAATAKPRIFHILWNNKIQLFDRTMLMLYYRLLGKKVVLNAHNVNAGKRDTNDSWMNRLSLKVQYSLSDHIFVHSERMKTELISEFDIDSDTVSAIPFGINNSVPNTALSTMAAKQQLGRGSSDKT